MLDIFGKVFGQSKGNKGNTPNNNGPTTAGNDQEGTRDSEQEDFVMVNGNNQQGTASATRPAMYPHLLLTNEMLVSPSQSSNQNPTANNQQPQPQPQLQPPQSHTSPGHCRVQSWATPLEMVPFEPGLGLECTSSSRMEDAQFLMTQETLNRVSVFLGTPSLSEYNFSLERQVLQEVVSSRN